MRNLFCSGGKFPYKGTKGSGMVSAFLIICLEATEASDLSNFIQFISLKLIVSVRRVFNSIILSSLRLFNSVASIIVENVKLVLDD